MEVYPQLFGLLHNQSNDSIKNDILSLNATSLLVTTLLVLKIDQPVAFWIFTVANETHSLCLLIIVAH